MKFNFKQNLAIDRGKLYILIKQTSIEKKFIWRINGLVRLLIVYFLILKITHFKHLIKTTIEFFDYLKKNNKKKQLKIYANNKSN